MGKWHYIEVHPSLDYNKTRFTSSLGKAVFNTDLQNVTLEMFRNLFDGTHVSAGESLLNRELREQLDNGHNLNAMVWSKGRFRLKTGLMQALSYLISGSYYRISNDGFNRFGINLGNSPTFTEASDRYIKNL